MRDGNPVLHKQFSVYLGVPISIIGLIGNLISIFVWSKINKKREESAKSVGMYLIALAVVDSGLLLCFLTYESLPELFRDINNNMSFVVYFCYLGFPMYYFFITASIWMVIGATANRFIAVVFPLKVETYNSLGVTKVVIATTVLFSFVVNIPHFFNKRPHIVNGTATIATTEYGKSSGAQAYDLWVHCMFLVLVPWIIICVLNGIIIRNLLFKTRIQKHKKSGARQIEYQTTITLLVVSISFLVFLIWQCIAQCFWMFHYGVDDPKIWFNVSTAYAPARLGVVINSSMNFVFYCLAGSFFRKEMRKIFCCKEASGYSRFSGTNSSYLSSSRVVTGYDEVLIDADNHERGKVINEEQHPVPQV